MQTGPRKLGKAKYSPYVLGGRIGCSDLVSAILKSWEGKNKQTKKPPHIKSGTAQSHPCHLAHDRRIRTETTDETICDITLASNPFRVARPDTAAAHQVQSFRTERLKTEFLLVKTSMQISPTDSTLIMRFADLKLDLRIFGLYNFMLTNNEINVFPLTTLRLLVAPQHTDTQTYPLP